VLLRLIFVCFALLGGGREATAGPEPVNRALLIGIGRYPRLPGAERQWTRLQGAEQSVGAMREVLEARKFGEVRTLLHEQATRAGIQRALGELAAASAKHDQLVVYFFGHGVQMTDRRDVGRRDEPDGLDEALVLYPTGKRWDYLRDDTLQEWLDQALREVDNVTVVLDSCHAGTATRGDNGVRALGGGTPLGAPATDALEGDEGSGGWLGSKETPEGLVVVSAAGPHQPAVEIPRPDAADGPWIGAFTYLFARTLAEAPAGTTWRGAVDRARSRMYSIGEAQRPEAEGAVDRVIFDTNEGRYDATWLGEVLAADRRTVTITNGGWMQSFVPGAYVEVLASERPGAAVIAIAEVVASDLQTATAVVRETRDAAALKKATTVGVRLRRQKEDHYVPRVDAREIEGDPAYRDLLRRLRASDRIVVIGRGDRKRGSDLEIVKAGRGRVAVVTGQGSRSDRLERAIPIPVTCTSRPAQITDDPARLEDAIELHRVWKRVESLSNPRSDALDVLVDLRVVGRAEDGRWEHLEPAKVRGYQKAWALPPDTLFFLDVVNRSDVPVRVAIIERTTAGTLQLLFPDERMFETADLGVIQPGERLAFPREKDNPFKADDVPGELTWKVVAMADPEFADFVRIVRQVPCTPAVRGGNIPTDNPLTELLEELTVGTRSGSSGVPDSKVRWGTAVRSLRILEP